MRTVFKTLALFLAVSLLTITAMPTQALQFGDIPDDHQNERAIDYLSDRGILKGQRDGRLFTPDQLLNRAEWAVIIVRSIGSSPSDEDYQDCFPDVQDQWFSAAVCFAHAQGWVQGYDAGPEAGNYGPVNSLNLAEILVMIQRQFNWPVQEGEFWYSGAIQYAEAKNLLSTDTKFYEPVTRAEAAEILFRAIALDRLRVERYDPFLAELLADLPDDEQPQAPIAGPDATVRLIDFGDQPATDGVAPGAKYIPVLRFQLRAEDEVTLTQLAVKRIYLGDSSILSRARLVINGRTVKEGPFSAAIDGATWSGLSIPLAANQLISVEVNVDVEVDAGPEIPIQFQVTPDLIQFRNTNVAVLGDPVIGNHFFTGIQIADSIRITNPTKPIRTPFVLSDREIIGRFDIYTGANDVVLKRIRLEDDGRISTRNYSNFRLLAGGSEVGFVAEIERGVIDFTVDDFLMEAPEDYSFTVLADIGDARIEDSIRIHLDDSEDIHAFDLDIGFGVQVVNEFGADVAWCAGAESTTCPEYGMRRRCSKEDIELDISDCVQQEEAEEKADEEEIPETCDDRTAPVCGKVNNTYQTFTNRCRAQQAQASGITPGPCSNEGAAVCGNEEAIVCAHIGDNQPKTYRNSCQARELGATVDSDGPCTDPDRACTQEFDPVCATLNVICLTSECPPVKRTFSNSCMANLAGATQIEAGECP